LVEQGEDEEFAIWGELDAHHFVRGLNFLIKLQLYIARIRALSQGVEFNRSVRRSCSNKQATSESFRIWVSVVAYRPNLLLVSLNALYNGIGIELPQKKLSIFSAEDHVFIPWQDSHAQHILFIQALLGLDLEIISLGVHEQVN